MGRLAVRENRFVSANGIEIKENENISKDFRALVNCLVDQEQIAEITGDESTIKGMVGDNRKTVIEVVEYEERKIESGYDDSSVRDCHNGHPQINPENFGILEMLEDPRPIIVKQGSEILIHGSAWIGEDIHWFQGELKETTEPIIIKNRSNGITAKLMEIHRPLLYNYWAQECSIKVKGPIPVVLNRRLLDDLELIVTGQIRKKVEATNNSFATDEKEAQLCEGLDVMFGMDIITEIDKAESMLIENDMKVAVTLDTEVSRVGEESSTFGKKEITHKSLLAEIRMIFERNSEGEITATRTFLNNVPRRFTIDLCANYSFILNTKDPERHRRFRVLRSTMKCVDNETEVTGIYYPEDINYEDSNKDHNTPVVQKIENVTEDPMPGIEVQISLKDIWNGLKQCEDILDNGKDIMAVTFMLKVEGPGTGNLPDECTELRTSMKAIEGRLALVLSISENDDIEIVRVFLNGIRRDMEIVPEMIWSKLFITEKPWRNRRFSIKNRISNDYFEEDNDTKIEKDDNEIEEDTDKRKEETNSNFGVGKKRCLIYKKDMETHRIAIPFKDSIIGKDEEGNETTDDPRNGGKMEVKSNQKKVLGGVPIYNRI